MDNIGIKVFNNDSGMVSMPSQNINSDERLIADNFGEAITGEVVQRVLAKTDTKLELPNYVIDVTKAGSVTVFQKEAIKSLIYKPKVKTKKEEADSIREDIKLVTIYLGKENKNMIALGKGEVGYLEKVLPLLKRYIFNDGIIIYQDFDNELHNIKVINDSRISYRLNL